MAIPVANIYYLLCYSWDEFVPRQMINVEAEQFPDTLHLFSRLLVIGLGVCTGGALKGAMFRSSSRPALCAVAS